MADARSGGVQAAMSIELDSGLQARLRGQLVRLPRLLEVRDPARLDEPAAPGAWSPREVLAHLGRHHEVMVERLRRILAETEPALPRYEVDRDPEWTRWVALRAPALQPRLLALRADLIRLVELLSPEQLARRGEHPALGMLSIPEWLEFFLLHEAHHLYRLWLQLGAPPRDRAVVG